MKSVIVANDFLTTLANNDVSKLTRGQAVLLNSAGKVVAAASDVKDDEMLQFVLGLGDGKVKRGVWINPKWSKQHKEKYLAPAGKTYKFTNLVANRGIGYQGFDAEVIISCKPINSFGGYPLEVYNASVTINGIDEASADIIARLKVEVEKTLTKINARFGADSITINDFTEASVTFTGAAGSLAGGVALRSMISPVSVRAAGSFANGVGVGFVGFSSTVDSVIYLLRYVGFFHHFDEVIWAVTHYVVVHFKSNVTLTFTICFHKCITCEWVCEDVAS